MNMWAVSWLGLHVVYIVSDHFLALARTQTNATTSFKGRLGNILYVYQVKEMRLVNLGVVSAAVYFTFKEIEASWSSGS